MILKKIGAATLIIALLMFLVIGCSSKAPDTVVKDSAMDNQGAGQPTDATTIEATEDSLINDSEAVDLGEVI